MSTAENLLLAHAMSFESAGDFESIQLSTVVCALRSFISLYTVRMGCSTLSFMIADVPFFLQSTGNRTFGRETPWTNVQTPVRTCRDKAFHVSFLHAVLLNLAISFNCMGIIFLSTRMQGVSVHHDPLSEQ